MAEFQTYVSIDTDEMIDVLESEGYIIQHKDASDLLNLEDMIFYLHQDWKTLDGAKFEKKLKEFFSEALRITVI